MASRYSTIAIKPKVHEDIKKLAKHSFQTVGGYIEKLIEREMKQMKNVDFGRQAPRFLHIPPFVCSLFSRTFWGRFLSDF